MYVNSRKKKEGMLGSEQAYLVFKSNRSIIQSLDSY